jgi:UDP-N-acetylglucosamine 2-epimerase (hydrolysing)
MKKKRIFFITATRADFGKLKPLMRAVDVSPDLECAVFVSGMHLLKRYGMTIEEVRKESFTEIYPFMNLFAGEPMEIVLSNTISGLSRVIQENPVDLIVVHGDRGEALAGAIVGALRNVLVAHVEGGELSGTVDELLRHAVTKLSHVHFVANEIAADRLRQLGECPASVHVIGSPDVDVAVSDDLPSLAAVRAHYEIPFESYGIGLFHPVTTELDTLPRHIEAYVGALLESGHSFVIIGPNNDTGCDRIFEELERLQDHPRFRVFPSVRFEAFLTLMKNASFVVGNSSAGVREAPAFGVPSVNVGSRQWGRAKSESIIHVEPVQEDIVAGIARAEAMGPVLPLLDFGDGNSAERFIDVITSEEFWRVPVQKQFVSLSAPLQPT